MEKLRIHKMKYRNRGMANKKLKGLNEYHVIFKFNTDKEATGFITKVKEWYYSGTCKEFDDLNDAFNELKKNGEKRTPEERANLTKQHIDETPETNTVKEPAPAKRKAGRPSKKVVQG